jgi:hypothetical protein
MSEAFKAPLPSGYRRLAWNGLSFAVPANWELAVYDFLRRKVSRIELEDEYSIRLEAEWVRGKKTFDLKRIMKRYEEAAKPLTLKSDEQKTVKGLPEGWHATRYIHHETGAARGGRDLKVIHHELVTAFYLCPRSRLFCFFILHFMPGDKENPETVIRQLAATLQDHQDEPRTPWQLFDIAFTLPSGFTLEQTVFDIGAKLMVFKWQRRRYYLWFFSCADVFLKNGQPPAEWACGYLNGSRLFKAAVFYPDGKGGIAWRRRQPFFLGHRQEIARMCFRYQVDCYLRESDNKLVLSVFHYRHEEDRKMSPSDLAQPR